MTRHRWCHERCDQCIAPGRKLLLYRYFCQSDSFILRWVHIFRIHFIQLEVSLSKLYSTWKDSRLCNFLEIYKCRRCSAGSHEWDDPRHQNNAIPKQLATTPMTLLNVDRRSPKETRTLLCLSNCRLLRPAMPKCYAHVLTDKMDRTPFT